ncbi:MAG TPA: gamma-glutamyl-phosphate reductase, partial [Propionibacterium sp.]|nr:gamma-glutamyl-phosphate reductase [Propionibacterium sp.]
MEFRDQAIAARQASVELATLNRAQKDKALHAMADALKAAEPDLLEANEADVANARSAGTDEAIVDRLTLTTARIDAMVQGLRDLAALPDPVGDVVRGWKLPNGVSVRQVRVPFGV